MIFVCLQWSIISGEYIHCFPKTGTFWYWSGQVNAADTVLRGVIKVSAKAVTSLCKKLTVKLSGIDVPQDTNSGNSNS